MYFYTGGATTDKPSNLVKRFMIFKKSFLNKIIFPIIRFACAACTCQLQIEDHRETFYNFISIITECFSWIRRIKVLIECKNQGLKIFDQN